MAGVPADELGPFLEVDLLEMGLHRERSLELLVAVLALAQVGLKRDPQLNYVPQRVS